MIWGIGSFHVDIQVTTHFSMPRRFSQIIHSATHFTRWMDGTCKPVDVIVAPGDHAPDFTFFEDIKHNPQVSRGQCRHLQFGNF